ncbi:phage holin family protein [Symmachiella dynata]|uniref:Phage holin family protein n=1 Tax=Symmachiella dynata TaxID=2527995 RepID=A0A517ZUR5_9PLAN|nr:phage holin family protein [Symmachiella dynata]QDT50447.1 hypothetical protein Pan258_45060 [Symmachiella dynata]QDU46166.1 hypothetical protein Mal52_46650 [Symmachiella dynata]
MSEHNGSTHFPPRTVARNVGQFAHDVVSLAELQAELLKVDAEDYLKRTAKPLIALAITLVVALGCVPMALATLALGLVQAGLQTWLAFLIATVTGLIIASLSGIAGWLWMGKSFNAFRRSKQEFRSNLTWIKLALKGTAEKQTRSI